MADEERAIIFGLDLNMLSDRDKQELIVELGAEQHTGQWKSTMHFRQAAMSVISRERTIARRNLRGELTSTRLIARLGTRVENLLSPT